MTSDEQRRELELGANLVKELMAQIGAISDASCGSLDEDDNDGADGRDYPLMAANIDSALSGIANASGPRREGALRALADLLAQSADGGGFGAAWQPLLTTEGSYLRRRIGVKQ